MFQCWQGTIFLCLQRREKGITAWSTRLLPLVIYNAFHLPFQFISKSNTDMSPSLNSVIGLHYYHYTCTSYYFRASEIAFYFYSSKDTQGDLVLEHSSLSFKSVSETLCRLVFFSGWNMSFTPTHLGRLGHHIFNLLIVYENHWPGSEIPPPRLISLYSWF